MRPFRFHWDKIRLDLMSQRSVIEGPGHKLYNVAGLTDLSAERSPGILKPTTKFTTQFLCSVPCDFLLILASLSVVLHSAGYLGPLTLNFPNNLTPWLPLTALYWNTALI